MFQDRKYDRHAPKNIQEYLITATTDSQKCSGFLGNISPIGILFLIPCEDKNLFSFNANANISGNIVIESTNQQIPFDGSIMWVDFKPVKERNHYMLGIRFNDFIELPGDLLARTFQ